MGHRKSLKRNFAQYAQDEVQSASNPGVAATLAHLRSQDPSTQEAQVMEKKDKPEEWTTVGKGGKKQKTNNYPSLGYSELHKLNSMVNINQLQGLLLYCLADGNMAPSFVSIRHHAMVKKAVVLFVPGLERGMFDGSIELEPAEEDLIDLSEPGDDTTTPAATQEPLNDASDRPILTNPFSQYENQSGPLIDYSSPEKSSHQGQQVQTHSHSNAFASLNNHKHQNTHTSKPLQSPDDYLPVQLTRDKLPLPLKPLADHFTHLWPVKAPGDDKYGKVHSPLHAMLNSPITKTQEEKREDKQIKGPKLAREGKNWANKRTSVTEFITTKEQLIENEYVLHHVWFADTEESESYSGRRIVDKQTTEEGWVDTDVQSLDDGIVPDQEIQKGSITAGRVILALDCEMCKVEGNELALTRISLVEWDGTILMDELIKPEKPIIDYLTQYSGITPAKLKNVTTTLKDIQTRLLKEITPKHILIGHSLNSDLIALKLTHPFIIDTSILYPHPRGPPMKSSLKWLAQKYLNREIQKGHGTQGHDSVEDARACLDLVKLKCERGPQWGTSEALNESIFKRLQRTPKPGTAHGTDNGKTGAIIDHGAPEKNFGAMASYCIGCSSDAEVVAGIKRAVLGDPDGHYIPGGGVDFTWARFQDLAFARGWLIDHRHSPRTTQNPDSSTTTLAPTLTTTITHITDIHSFLPPCTLFIICSGTGDPREMARLQELQRTFKREYQVKKWDELSVKWTDVEEQGVKAAVRRARVAVGLMTST